MPRATILDPNRAGKQAEELQNKLHSLIIGQNEAIDQIVDFYQTYLAGLTAQGRPIKNFLFLGPTGCGKTRTVEATAEVLTQTPDAVIKIDCGEFQDSHEVAKLISSPPGYLGHRETHALLSQEVLNQHHTETIKIGFVLFDEIEKASDSLWNLLLGILDKATLTLGDNRRVDFSQAMIFMTSNLGAREMGALTHSKMDFQTTRQGASAEVEAELTSKMSKTALEAARRKFTPEFINRIDKIAVFRPLGPRLLESQLRKAASSSGASDSIRMQQVADPVDMTQEATERDLAVQILERESMLVRRLRSAIDRIANGSYYICMQCEEEIAPKRLSAMPWAERSEAA